jgi:hypothetical protein
MQFDFVSITGEEASWAHLYGANSSIKRGLLERVGGYDEERLPYLYEDLDWSYRARQHGLRVIFNRRAVVDHWRPMSVDIWRARAPMLAAAEWQFCRLHPDVPPHYQPKLAAAARQPAGGRRSALATRFVPPDLPLLGPFVWGRANLHWLQQIAPPFLEVWNRAAAGEEPPTQPDVPALLTERSANSAGS